MRVKEYEYDKATVDAWLNNGGAEIVLETLRRRGWDIEILMGDDWPYVDDVVVVANRETGTMEINGYKSPCQQAFFAILVERRETPTESSRDYRKEFMMPILREGDKFLVIVRDLCYHDIDEIRTSSEATIASSAGKEEIMSDKEAVFTAKLLEAVKKTDTWENALMSEKIESEYEAMKDTMCRFVDSEAEDEIMGKVFGYVEEVTSAAILYGIRVADALRGSQLLPAEVNAGT